MFRLPESPRARARFYRRSAIGLALAIVAVLLVFFRNTGHSLQTPIVDKPADVVRPPKRVPLPASHTLAEHTLLEFVQTAVLRRDPGAAWELATPHMREGSTRAEWARGLMPVVPYPSREYREAGLTLKGSYHLVLRYDVLVLPKSPKGEQRVYACELHDLRGRWLVDWCYPRTTL